MDKMVFKSFSEEIVKSAAVSRTLAQHLRRIKTKLTPKTVRRGELDWRKLRKEYGWLFGAKPVRKS